jgi:hypothetical protein
MLPSPINPVGLEFLLVPLSPAQAVILAVETGRLMDARREEAAASTALGGGSAEGQGLSYDQVAWERGR